MKKLIILFLLLISWAWAASASYISLNTTVNTKVDKDLLKVLVSVVNKGDESAHNVQAELRVGDKKILAEKRQELGVNATYKAIAEFKLDLKMPGQYPLIVVLHYADANQYPFSALTCQTFSYKAKELPFEIFGRMESATFWKKGKIKLTLKNMSESEMAASSYLVTPRELTGKEGSLEIRLEPKSENKISFSVENFSALHGSNYQVFAISEYERDGIHQTNITPGMIKIVESKEIFGISYIVVIAVLFLLVLVFIAAQFIRKK
jgi:hypothetical protein